MTQSPKIKERLHAAGLKAVAVAERLGIDDSSLSLKLSGKRPWRPEELLKIRDVLAETGAVVTLDELFEAEAA